MLNVIPKLVKLVSSANLISVDYDYTYLLIDQVLKYGFHNKSFILNAPLVSCPLPVVVNFNIKLFQYTLPNSSHLLWVGAAANPPKADDWNWSTDQRCIYNKKEKNFL